jgi:small subunit ribosomal protein S16
MFYRIVVADGRSPRDGRFIEQLGWYDPQAEPAKVEIDLARYKYWIGVGARPSETVAQLTRRAAKAAAAAAPPA